MRGFILIFEAVSSRKGPKPNDCFSIFDRKRSMIGNLGITMQREYES